MEVFALAGGLAAGYMIAHNQPRQNPNKKGASVFVLGCIDPRFSDNLAWFLTHSEKLHDDYDLVCLAGASLGAIQNEFPSWRQTFVDHLNLAIQLHDVKEVWVFDHYDCGFYKAHFQLDSDKAPQIHVSTMLDLQSFIAQDFPALGFKGFIINVDGTISQHV